MTQDKLQRRRQLEAQTFKAFLKNLASKSPPSPPSPASDESERDYQSWFQLLPSSRRQSLKRLEKPPQPSGPSLQKELEQQGAKWHLVVDGDIDGPVTLVFDDPEEIPRQLAEYEGQDIYVFCYYGLQVPFSQAPWRYVFTPDGRILEYDEKYNRVRQLHVSEIAEGVELQKDGFMGSDELVEPLSEDAMRKLSPPKPEGWKRIERKNKKKSPIPIEEEFDEGFDPEEEVE